MRKSVIRIQGWEANLEGLVAQIDAPRVTRFSIEYFSQPVYQVPQLAQFLVRSECLALSSLQIRCIPWIHLWFCGDGGANLIFQINTSGMVRGVLHSAQVMQQISASISNNTELFLVGPAPASTEPPFGGPLYGGDRFRRSLFPPGSLFSLPVAVTSPREELGVPNSIDHIDWIGLFRPFTGVNTLSIRGGDLSESIVHALELVSGDMVAKVLPALHSLVFVRERPVVSVHQFVSVRQNSGRLVTVSYPDDDDDDDEGEDDDENNEDDNDNDENDTEEDDDEV
jgi:hypothetical protein